MNARSKLLLGLALVATGMGLVRVSFTGSRLLIIAVATLKLVVHPMLVFLLAKHVFALPPVWIGAATMFAACPTGINAFFPHKLHLEPLQKLVYRCTTTAPAWWQQ